MKSSKILNLLTAFLISAPLFVAGTAAGSQVSVQETPNGPNSVLVTTTYSGSDPLAIGDPLGNHPLRPQDDAGPLLTQRLSYDASCQDEACVRARIRWNSPTSWQQDRASGLSQ